MAHEPLTAIPAEVLLELARGRRKARIECLVPGCDKPMIKGKLTCRTCYAKTPGKLRRENEEICREFKTASDPIQARMLLSAADRNCVAILNAVVAARKGRSE